MGNSSTTVHAACVQYQARVEASVEAYQETIERFAGMARERHAELLVLPEGMGLLLAAPLLTGTRSRLARAAASAADPRRPLKDRARGLLARPLAGILRADYAAALMEWLENPDNLGRLEETYVQMYAKLARRYQLVIVAGTCPHPATPPLALHSTYVFGPDGALLGRQDQTHILRPRWRGHAPGNNLAVIRTPAGNIGVLIGEDILFPETARALAGAGADILVHLAAVHEAEIAHAMHIAFQARIIENELYGIECFLVGHIPWRRERQEAHGIGTSCIAGPAPITGRVDGIIAGMGSAVEGLLIGELDLEQLHAWWEQSPGSLRQAVRPEIYRAVALPVRRPAPAAAEAETAPRPDRIPEAPEPAPHEALEKEEPGTPVPAEEDWKAIVDETASDEEIVRSALEALAKEQDEWERRRDIWD